MAMAMTSAMAMAMTRAAVKTKEEGTEKKENNKILIKGKCIVQV